MNKSPVEVQVWAQDPLSMPERVVLCARFRSNELSVAPYPITRLKAPGV